MYERYEMMSNAVESATPKTNTIPEKCEWCKEKIFKDPPNDPRTQELIKYGIYKDNKEQLCHGVTPINGKRTYVCQRCTDKLKKQNFEIFKCFVCGKGFPSRLGYTCFNPKTSQRDFICNHCEIENQHDIKLPLEE